MIENYYSYFSFISGVNSNASSQALPNSLPVTTPTIRLDCTGRKRRSRDMQQYFSSASLFWFSLDRIALHFGYGCNRMYDKTSRSVGLIQPLDHRGLHLNKRGLMTTDSYYNNSNCQLNTTRKITFFSKMALKWLNRLSSLLQHLFDITAIKTEMIMMMMLKVLMQCSSFYNMIHQNLHMHNNFIFAGWTVFNRKINIFEIMSLQLSYLEKSVHQPAIS